MRRTMVLLAATLLLASSPVRAGDAAGAVERGMDRGGDAAARGLDKAGEATGRALDKAMDKTGEGLGWVIDKTGRGLEKAGEALKKD